MAERSPILNALNSPWRVSSANRCEILGADFSPVATCVNPRHASIIAAAPQMYFALEAMLSYYEPDNSEAAEYRNLGVMALAKAKGIDHD